MVWTFMGNTRMYNALRDYGDRISQIDLFSFKVRATGEIYESGVSISSMLTYINRYPHINWLLTMANDGTNSIFRALRDNTNGAQNWLKGVYNFTGDGMSQPFIPFEGYWDDNNKVPWALPHVYDYMEGRDAERYSYPQMSGTYNGRHHLTARN